MTRRFASCVFSTLLILAMAGTAAAQGRGRGGFAGAPGRMGPASAPARMGQGPAAGRMGGPPARVARPPGGAAAPAFSQRFHGPGPAHVVGRPGVRFIQRQPQVIIASPYSGFYNGYYPYGWPSAVYSTPAYVDAPYSEPYVEPSPSQTELDLQYEVDRLKREVERLREVQADTEARLSSPPPPPVPETPQIPITLVFRDGRRLSVLNYAIAGQTLWVMDEERAVKFALGDLDFDATKKANPERALRFPHPTR